ncbi:MAG: type II secretion system protein [Candidatus Xenobiia bacterium LiM19]
MPVSGHRHKSFQTPEKAWQEELTGYDQSLGRYRLRHILREEKDFAVFEAEDMEALGQTVELRIYRWDRQGEYGPQWQQWRRDARTLKISGKGAVTALSTRAAGITVTYIPPTSAGKRTLKSVLRDPMAILFAEIIAVLIAATVFHIIVLHPGAEAARAGAEREACRGNLRHIETALTMYYSDHGKYPAALLELVPAYLPKPLTCPKGGTCQYTPPGSTDGEKSDEQARPASLRCSRCGP